MKHKVVLVIPENGDLAIGYKVSDEQYNEFETLMTQEEWNKAAEYVQLHGKQFFAPYKQVFEV